MHTRVRHMATHTGVRICLCACLCGVVHLSREQGDTHRSAGEGRSPRDAFVPPPLVLPRSHRPAEALMRTRFSVPLSTNALGTTPQLRKKAQLCSKRSAERSQDTNSGFWPAENKKEGNARKTRNQVALRAKRPRAQRRQGHCRRKWRSTCAAHCEQREILNDLDADNGDTKRTTTEHAKSTRANVPLPPLQQNQPPCKSVVRPKKVIHIQRGLSK